MQSLTSLPAELRQLILSFVLPTTVSATWLRPILPILSVNRLLRKDAIELASQWGVLIILRTPACFQHISHCPLSLPMHAHIVLDIFSTGSGDLMHRQGDWQWDDSPMDHFDLINAWSCAASTLPAQFAGRISLDITPAPAAKRTQHPLSLYKFVNDVKCRAFLFRHAGVVERLVGQLQRQCPMAEVCFVGTVGYKCVGAVERMQTSEAIARRVEFEGTWVSSEMATAASLGSAAKSLGKKGNARRIQPGGKTWLLEPLRGVEWDGKTAWIYAKAAFAEGEEVVKRDLKMIAEWRYDDERHYEANEAGEVSSGEEDLLSMPPASALRRALQHGIATGLGLSTRSQAEGEERQVVVMRESGDLERRLTITPKPASMSLGEFFSTEALLQADS